MSPHDSSIGEAITAQGLEELRAELDELEGGGRAAIAKRISAAREMGDLKENAEYHIAKEDQGHMETKILRLQARLRAAVVVEARPVPTPSASAPRSSSPTRTAARG